MMRIVISALAAGLVFGLGISLSGMANPAKVINFFDIAGSWDPSLAFVMGGASIVAFFGYKVVLAKNRPWFETEFSLPTRSDIDLKLISGAILFGIGWGLAGFCPGGALPALGTGNTQVVMFVAALVLGMVGTRQFEKRLVE